MNVTAWGLTAVLAITVGTLGWQMIRADQLADERDLWRDDAAYQSDRADALEDRANAAEADLARTEAAYARTRANAAAARLRLGHYEAIIQKIEERPDANDPISPAVADALERLRHERTPAGGGDGDEAGAAPGPR